MKQQQQGYVMVLAMMLIALIVILVSTMSDTGRVHVRFIRTMINRQKAQALAWSGVQIGMSQLASLQEGAEKKDEKKKKPAVAKPGEKPKETKAETVQQEKQEIITLLPVLNDWQVFPLTKKNDGIKGEIKICIGCEEGKININRFFDFARKKFIDGGQKGVNAKKMFEELFKAIQEKAGKKLFGPFEKFLKERQTLRQGSGQGKLYDPTELLGIKEFEPFQDAVFYRPGDVVRDQKEEKKQTVYLNDIFTLWSSRKELNPWFLSNSLKQLLGLKIRKKGDAQLQSKKMQEQLKGFSAELKWPGDWNKMLAPLYDKKFDRLPKELRKAMDTKFEPTVFSVLSYGTVGGVTQKLFVILERKKSSSTDSSGKSSTSFEFRTRKFYWL